MAPRDTPHRRRGGARDALKGGEATPRCSSAARETPLIQRALRDPAIRLMSLSDAARLSAAILLTSTKLTLPRERSTSRSTSRTSTSNDRHQGHARRPRRLSSRAHQPADRRRREIHGRQGYFEAAGEFPGTEPLDLPRVAVRGSAQALRPELPLPYLPFWLAALSSARSHPPAAARRAGPAAQLSCRNSCAGVRGPASTVGTASSRCWSET